MTSKQLNRLFYVEWLDSSRSDGGWEDRETMIDNARPVMVCSVGWLVKDTGQAVTLVPHLCLDKKEQEIKHGLGTLTIPVGTVKKMRPISAVARKLR